MDSCKVVIVGAGIAGISAASRLCEAGCGNVVILEASDRIGGRIHTVQFGDDEMPIEMGANWIHGSSHANSVFSIADQIGAITPYRLDNTASHRFLREDGTEIDRQSVLTGYNIFKKAEHEMYSQMKALKPENGKPVYIPITRYLQLFDQERQQLKPDQNVADITLVLTAFENYIRNHEGDELERIAWEGSSSWNVEEGGEIHIPGGYVQILQHLMKGIPRSALKLNSEVTKISYAKGGRKTLVTIKNGAQYEADHVIVTCSIGYLKKHMGTLFDPPLPIEKSRTIRSIGMGRMNKIFLEFESPVTKPSYNGIILAWKDSKVDKATWYKRILGFDQVFTKDNTILGWVAGDGAEYMEDLSDDEIGITCVKILKQFMGRADLPRLKAIRVSRWCSNPYTLGSYSHQTERLTPGEQEDLARPVRCPLSKKPLLMFAGEALVNACTQGARDTALSAASAIIEHYTTSKL
ncbi:spermine oxidase-like [Dreissena polymorpha]|uniref:Amine oxidase domain-containing protein n=1 Tax=Dreissena polymorpha TaxID=45954 RepID=A0A9D4LTD8_DREPO|nr:spermine oxidase-like [Dreissena polymorpha]KAH3862526.1 hypothetical protein DPMN_025493 [Dreissena polymorpha]